MLAPPVRFLLLDRAKNELDDYRTESKNDGPSPGPFLCLDLDLLMLLYLLMLLARQLDSLLRFESWLLLPLLVFTPELVLEFDLLRSDILD